MPDLIGTCPKSFWEEWLAEGDCAGDIMAIYCDECSYEDAMAEFAAWHA